VSPRSRLGQAYLSPGGSLFVVVSDPWIHPWVSETEPWHTVVCFPAEARFNRSEATIAELTGRPGWTRLA
jgi:hypothetical protein